jgi:DNA-binding NarL/FixJ family response regulator
LVILDGRRNLDILSSRDGGPPPAWPVIEHFLGRIPARSNDVSYGNKSETEVDLSAREVEVLKLLVTGHSNQDIAEALVISPSTVAKHVSSILSKTGTANRTEAATYSHRHRLL